MDAPWYILLCVVPAVLLYNWWRDPLNRIPTVGPSAPLLSYIGAYRFFVDARDMLQEGYEKYKGSTFKVPMFDRWLVVVNGRTLIEELRRLDDDKVSALKGAEVIMKTQYTLGESDDQYHVGIIRETLTRSLVTVLPDVMDEIARAFDEYLPMDGDKWTEVDSMSVMPRIVARASNRVFVGLPHCRNLQYLDLAINFTFDVMKGTIILNLTPAFLRSWVARQFLPTTKTKHLMGEILSPLIEERRQLKSKNGDNWADKPNDMLMWLIDEAEGNDARVNNLVMKMLIVNFGAIHTSSNSVTHALYQLAAEPQYIQPLREEVEAVVASKGWTKTALTNMWKLDSFMKESQRVNGISSTSMTRLALKDLHLSDGTFIPAGSVITAAATATHSDDELYPNAAEFDPFRFSRLREAGDALKHQYISTSAEYIVFGHGKHACPGRFFAANELKAMLAYVVLKYDVKFKHEGVRPENKWFAAGIVPDPTARVLFRRRQT
ncbi:hypothetical protein CERSUDRAFT_41330 [Gelatoporia subvermispora B]|uniref:Cytochrome P450 n=1 Tax=Ceriporiopsis subvermispora (strain B) TaxID=914234 RepID=M2RUX5_CERS8|nr:hypothetical protein CERSUDRAFT_41330 [Gelatoporia subvermispora B]